MIDLRDPDLSLVDFLPESIASEADIVALSLAIDPELRGMAGSIIEAVILPRISELSEPVCNSLAWAFRLNELQVWDDASLDGKRELLANIFAIRKKSGTTWSVRRIFDLLSVVGRIVEWWEEGAAPYTYRVRITVTGDPGIALRTILQVPELTHRFAPTRSKLTEFAIEADSRGSLRIYPALTVGHHTTIGFGP